MILAIFHWHFCFLQGKKWQLTAMDRYSTLHKITWCSSTGISQNLLQAQKQHLIKYFIQAGNQTWWRKFILSHLTFCLCNKACVCLCLIGYCIYHPSFWNISKAFLEFASKISQFPTMLKQIKWKTNRPEAFKTTAWCLVLSYNPCTPLPTFGIFLLQLSFWLKLFNSTTMV